MLHHTLSLISTYRGSRVEDFLAACLPALRADLAHLASMRAYRIAQEALVVWWSSVEGEDSNKRYELDDLPLHRRAIAQRQVQMEGQRIALPLIGHDMLYGLLELNFSPPEGLPTLESLSQVTDLLSMRLENLLINRLIEQEISASSALNACEDFKQVAAVMADYFIGPGQFIAIVLYDYDEDGQIIGMRNVATANRRRSFSTDDIVPVSAQVAQAHHQVLSERGQVFITDIDSDPLLISARLWLKQLKIRSMYHAALRSAQGVYGFINWNDTRGIIALTELETLAYSALVEQAAAVIESRRIANERLALLEESRRQTNRLQAITAFSQSVQVTQNIEEILSAALDVISQLLNFDHAEIFGYDRTSRRLRLVAQQSFGKREVFSGAGLAINLEDDSSIQRVWASRRILKVDDLETWQGFHPMYGKLLSIVTMPVVVSGRYLGVVELGSAKRCAFSDDDVSALLQMANQLAVAISNADAYRQSQMTAATKTLINDISSRIQQQTDVEAILATAARELGQVLGARRVRLRLSAVPGDSQR
ncbi:MAG: GAF domain-containing protein [Anaerolineae bacterium]|nr:GAF domain-containing protein [Anaerolineae bacterium]MDW8173671.1 GAF domain-containing protein [Anaerolineae bacterium]